MARGGDADDPGGRLAAVLEQAQTRWVHLLDRVWRLESARILPSKRLMARNQEAEFSTNFVLQAKRLSGSRFGLVKNHWIGVHLPVCATLIDRKMPVDARGGVFPFLRIQIG
jgi:hypothetical protein